MLCDYGCKKEAKYQFKNGKWCCEKSTSSCSEMRKKNSNANLGKFNNKKGNRTKFRVPWNKGLDKNKSKIVNEYSKKISTSVKKLFKENKLTGRAFTIEKEIERKSKISESLRKNPNSGGYREGSGYGIKTKYLTKEGLIVSLDSSYELAYVKYLDSKNIPWKKNWTKFPYEFEQKIRNYIPDFYLPNENLYIEVKGYETEKDRAKWKAFPFKLKVLRLKDLIQLGAVER